MKKVLAAFFPLFLLAQADPAHAGTANSSRNDALGFVFTQYPQGEVDADICDGTGHCYSFRYVKALSSDTVLYREVNGRCELNVQTFDKKFGTGSTKNDFMLELIAFVVKVTKGEDVCVLSQSGMQNTMRALTAIYE